MDKKAQNPNEINMQYNRLRQEYAQIFRVVLDLEEEKKEHLLVLETLKPLEKERRCWRLVGGVLVERLVGEVTPSLEQNVELIEKTLGNYNEELKKKEKEIIELEREYGLKNDRLSAEDKKEIESKKTNTGGVLA